MPARFNFPLFLTWLRIVAIPVFVVVLYVPESWLALRNCLVSKLANVPPSVTLS